MSETKITNKGEKNISVGNDFNISNYALEFKPMYIFDPQDMSDIINTLYDAMENEPDPSDDFFVLEIEKKNEINHIDNDFYEECIKENYAYFSVIGKFLNNPANRKIEVKFRGIITEVKGKIINDVKSGKNLQAVLPCLFDYAKEKYQDMFTSKGYMLNVLAYYMYANCDIGEKYVKAE